MRTTRCRCLVQADTSRRLHKRDPSRVESWCNEQDAVSRADIQRLAASLDDVDTASASSGAHHEDKLNTSVLPRASSTRTPGAQQPAKRSARLMARFQDKQVEVIPGDVPREPEHVYVRGRSAARRSVLAREVQLVGIETTAEG